MIEKTYDIVMDQAVRLHRQGQLASARALYEKVLAAAPGLPPARHNLGMVLIGLGHLRRGVELVEQVMMQHPDDVGRAASYREIGLVLFHQGYWEQARPWLERAAPYFSDDRELRRAIVRTAPRGYLAPEIYDPVAGEVLARYAPREAEHYVYVVEIVSACNLSCPSCPVGNFTGNRLKRGLMPLETFEKIVNKISTEKPSEPVEIWLFNWGEPLLHPQLPAFIDCIRRHGMICQLSSNLNIEKGLERLVAAGPDVLKISLSGLSQETYGRYHRGGSIHLVRSNMHRLRYLLDKTGAATRVWVGHHLYRTTVQQMNAVKALCQGLGFGYHPIQAFYQPLEKNLRLMAGDPETAQEAILDDLLVHPRALFHHIKAHRSGGYDCELRFNQTVINADGSVALCCNVFDEANMLGVQFLESSPEEQQRLKYTHSCCKACRGIGADYSVSRLPEQVHAGRNENETVMDGTPGAVV